MLDISFIDNIFLKKKIRSIFASKTRYTFVQINTKKSLIFF